MPAWSAAELDDLACLGRVEDVPRRTRSPLDGTAVVFVRAGWFRGFRNAAFVRDVTLLLAGPGDVLAPGSVFGDRSAENGAEAITDGRLLLIEPVALERYAAARPAFYTGLAESLARRTLRVERRLEALSRIGVEERVAAALLELAEDAGTPLAGGAIRLDLPLSQDDLAGLAGTTRASCSSAVAALGRRGLLQGRRLRGLILVDPAALAELAAVDFPPG